MYLSLDSINSIQLDHTSRCNLMCPQCARVSDSKINPNLPIKDLSIADYELIFTPFKGKNINIFHCGNYGDVIASPTFNDTLEWCNNNGFHDIMIITNGSARNADWWRDLAKRKVNVVFSIDGLRDTSPIYRVNSNFDKVIENVEAFTSAGGNARWDYIVFEHNHHQVEEAMRLAKSLGIKKFNIKNTTRFITPAGYNNTVVNKKEKIVTDRNDNPIVEDYTKIVKSYGSFEEYVRHTDITCKYKLERRIYIDFETRVWPCCWIGAPIFFHNETVQSPDIQKILQKFGHNFNRIDMNGWDNILSHEFFDSYLENSWKDSSTRIYTCGRTCGAKYEFSSGYGKNKDITQL